MSSLTKLLDDITVITSCSSGKGIQESLACGDLEKKRPFVYPAKITTTGQFAKPVALQAESSQL